MPTFPIKKVCFSSHPVRVRSEGFVGCRARSMASHGWNSICKLRQKLTHEHQVSGKLHFCLRPKWLAGLRRAFEAGSLGASPSSCGSDQGGLFAALASKACATIEGAILVFAIAFECLPAIHLGSMRLSNIGVVQIKRQDCRWVGNDGLQLTESCCGKRGSAGGSTVRTLRRIRVAAWANAGSNPAADCHKGPNGCCWLFFSPSL
jgi:hypothetical protein